MLKEINDAIEKGKELDARIEALEKRAKQVSHDELKKDNDSI